MQILVAVRFQVERKRISLGAPIVHVPSECILPCKQAPTVVTLVVPLLHVHTLIMPLQVCLSNELLGTVLHLAGERVLAVLVMSLLVGLEVVTATKELPASFDRTGENGVLLSSEASRLSSALSRHTRQPTGLPQECRSHAAWPGVDGLVFLGVILGFGGWRPRVWSLRL